MEEKRAQAAKMVRILTDAKAVISDESKWCKGRLHEGERSCALGAIHKAIGIPKEERNWDTIKCHYPQFFEAGNALGDVLGEISPLSYGRVPHLNDASHTTHSDVMKLFDDAIESQCKIVRGEDQ